MCLAIGERGDRFSCVAGETSIPTGGRSLAANIVSSIAGENGGFFRKNSAVVQRYLQIAVQMISDIDEDPEWEQGTFGDEDELLENDSIPHVVGITVEAVDGCEVDGGESRRCAACCGVQAGDPVDHGVQPVS